MVNNNSEIIIRIPLKIKNKLKELCASELMTMSHKIKQLILTELKNKSIDNE